MLGFEIPFLLVLAYWAVISSHTQQPAWWARLGIDEHLDFVSLYVRVFEFHIGLVVLFAGLIAAFLRWWRLAAASLPIVAFTLAPVAVSYTRSAPPSERGDLRVVTCNLFVSNLQKVEMAEDIRRTDADVICVQELTPELDEQLRNTLGSAYPYIASIPQPDAFGAGIYSKLPFAGEPGKALPGEDDTVVQQRVNLLVAGTTITIYNLHFYPPASLLAYQEQKSQVRDLIERARQESNPLLVAGDFNLPSSTRQVQQIIDAGMLDAFSRVGRGRGSTWPAIRPWSFAPGLQLDHLFVTKGITCHNAKVLPITGSDHRMVYGDFVLAGTATTRP